ncbi:C-terminal binding protein [Ethanoligenens sp.]|uniref:C-terminal binding protein n=1 Tax=Ethanoligenens sp. TaxID=2099655 RepID=UPI0039E9A02E
MKPCIWVIDEEWPDYQIEENILKQQFPGCTIRYSNYDYAGDLEAFGKEADAVLCQVYAHIPRETVERLEKCKIIALFGGGYDRIDVKAAGEKGIPVTFVPGYCTEDLSDYVLAGIFHFNKRLLSYGSAVSEGLWGAQAVTAPVHRVTGSTLLVVGVGRIGTAVAKKARALGMNVLGYDPYVDAAEMETRGAKKVELSEGLAAADYVSLNPKYYEETDSLLGWKEFNQMKPTAVIINTSRGKVMVEEDLIRAVKEKVIAGAVLDVVSNEPPDLKEPIFGVENIIVTPHISYISQESFAELKTRATMNVVKALKGETLTDLARY